MIVLTFKYSWALVFAILCFALGVICLPVRSIIGIHRGSLFESRALTTISEFEYSHIPSDSVSSLDTNQSFQKPLPQAKPKSKKKAVVKQSAREASGYSFSDSDGEYDVPLIGHHMWYRLRVRKNFEKKFCQSILDMHSKTPTTKDLIADVYCPASTYVKFKGKSVVLDSKPLIPGLVYIKMKMGPDLADDIENVNGVYGFTKTSGNIVLPLSEDETFQLENQKIKAPQQLTEAQAKLRKGEYVSIVKGPLSGRYGILMGVRLGRLEVCLRSDYKDDWEVFDLDQLEYLAVPPEKKWNEMTAKEAAESLMAKDPHNPTIKALKKQGLLEAILYPDGKPGVYRNSNIKESDEYISVIKQGNTGIPTSDIGEKPYSKRTEQTPGTGKRIRSIALQKKSPPKYPMSSGSQSSEDRSLASMEGKLMYNPFTRKSGEGSVGSFEGLGERKSLFNSANSANRNNDDTRSLGSWNSNDRQSKQEVDASFDSFLDDLFKDVSDSKANVENYDQKSKSSEQMQISKSSTDILDDLLKDISSNGDDEGPPKKLAKTKKTSAASKTLKEIKAEAKSTQTQKVTAPRMENYDSFEKYLDALVNYERRSASESVSTNSKNSSEISFDDDLFGLFGDQN